MKALFALSLLLPTFAFGQSLTSHSREQRTILAEEFTGIHCGSCPAGRALLDSIATVNPGRVSIVGIHAGEVAVPDPGEPDFRTFEGSTLDTLYGINSHPAALINRYAFADGTVQDSGAWPDDAAFLLSQNSPINIGLESSYDTTSHWITVHVQLYTYSSQGTQAWVTVLVTENNLVGPQEDQNDTVPDYIHDHVLRDYLTDLGGEEVPSVQGITLDRTYYLVTPPDWDIANCEVTAFVAGDEGNVYQARIVAADGGSTPVAGSMAVIQQPYHGGASGVPTTFTTDFLNQAGSTAHFVAHLSSADAPATWATGVMVDGVPVAAGDTFTVADATTVPIVLTVTPDATPGYGNYLLNFTSVEYPDAALMQREVHVISGVEDLIVSNPGAEAWETLYSTALVQAGETSYARMTRDQYFAYWEGGSLGGVQNVYYNVSRTFPTLTDDMANALHISINNGLNLMIAGQDIAWDQSSAAGATGTSTTRAVFMDSFYTQYISNGSMATSGVDFTDADPVFGGMAGSGIADVFGDNTGPDRIQPIPPAVAILNYNDPDSIGGIRAQTDDYKLVYFAVGPEQMADPAVGRQMIQLSHDWFHGIVGIAEFDAAIRSLGQAYPVPADGQLTIPVNALQSDVTLEVFDAMGRSVLQRPASRNAANMILDTRELSDGVYNYRLRTATSAGTARSFVVAH